MRKALTVLCALITAALFPIAELISRGLPADTGSYVEQKYAGWNGVLQAWVCCAWNPGGSFISWLNGCAADFERAHNGVYIEFTPVDEAAMREMMEGKLRRPELIFFSPGILTDSDGLNALETPGNLRMDLRLNNHALPVAMGGYIWVYNTALADGTPVRNKALPLTSLTDGGGRSFAPALIALLSAYDSRGEISLMRLIGVSMGRINQLYLIQNAVAGAIALALALLAAHGCLLGIRSFVASMGIVLNAAKIYPVEWAILLLVFVISILPTSIMTLRMSRQDSIDR